MMLKKNLKKNLYLCLLFIFYMNTGVLAQRSWSLALDAPSFSIGLNRQNPSTIYVGGDGRRVYKTYDAGKTWDTLTIDFNGGNGWIASVFVHPQDTNIVFAGGTQCSAIWRSTDGGRRWERAIEHMFPPVLDGDSFVCDPKNPDVMYCVTMRPSYLFRSRNRGRTWDTLSKINVITSRDTIGEVFTIAMRPDSSNILFLGCEGGKIIKSMDSGKSWERVVVNESKNAGDVEVPVIVFSKHSSMIGYSAFTYFFEDESGQAGGIYKTTDGGNTWNKAGYRDTSMWALDVRSVGNEDELVVGGFTMFFDYPGAGIVGITGNGGSTWQDESAKIPWSSKKGDKNVWMIRYGVENTGKLYMATERGFFVYDQVLSVSEPPVLSEDVEIFPNPVTSRLQVRSGRAGIRAEVFTLLGQSVGFAESAGESVEFSTDILPTGAYFVRVWSGGKMTTKAFQVSK